ncbi:N-terminal phage integrase SAM-like domain-containing protein [Evansella sp. AB-rgal1]|uniref:N-terminal phage integrase SAM-like domain-containing protein n=1 Tax=Evansella sp. AB-rgal1 TaxID=3242696 RepID=UPI00359CBBB9
MIQMTGSVRLDKKSKKYLYVIEVGSDGNRKRKVKKGFKTKKEAKNAMALALTELQKEGSALDEDGDITFGDYLEYWLSAYAKSSTAPNTYKGYERMIRVHLKPSLGEKKLRSLTTRDIQDYYTDKLTSKIHHEEGEINE